MRPPGAATSSMTTTSWARAASRWAAVSPEMPPPTIAIRTRALEPAPTARGRFDQIGQRADEGRVAPHGAGTGEVDDARPLGALFVEDVDLLQRLDVLAREGDRNHHDGFGSGAGQVVERHLGRGAEPALRTDAALKAQAGACTEPQALGHRGDRDAHVVEVGIAALDVDLR